MITLKNEEDSDIIRGLDTKDIYFLKEDILIFNNAPSPEIRVAQLERENILLKKSNLTTINSPTYQKLVVLMKQFPIEYPNYKTEKMKISDVESKWIKRKDNGFDCNNKESGTFIKILNEHYKFAK